MLSKIGFLTSTCSSFVHSSLVAPFFCLWVSPHPLLYPPRSSTLALCFKEAWEAGRQSEDKELIRGVAWDPRGWEGVVGAHPLVPFEGVPQLANDGHGLVGLASSRLKKEDKSRLGGQTRACPAPLLWYRA